MTSNSNKADQLARLARLRRSKTAGTSVEGYSTNYKRLEDFADWLQADGRFVSPWTNTAQNFHSSIMIVGQDWAAEDYLTKPGNLDWMRPGYDERLTTNKNLICFLREAFGAELRDIYATNAFVFVKPGGMQARIRANDLRLSAKTFTLQEIAIVQPKIVICLGAKTFKALRTVLGLRSQLLSQVDYEAPDVKFAGAEILCVPHPGSWGSGSAKKFVRASECWRLVAKRLCLLESMARPGVGSRYFESMPALEIAQSSLTSSMSESIITDTKSGSSSA